MKASFYSISEGTIKVPLLKVDEFLKERGYFRYMASPESTVYVKIEDNKVTQVSGIEIYDYIMSQAKVCELENEDDREALIDKVSSIRYKIISNLPTSLQPANLNFVEDTPAMSYIFYKNLVVTITKDAIETKEYKEISGHIWKNQILAREYIGSKPPATYHELENPFYKFLNAINPGANLDSLMSIIGYSLHRYKKRSFAKAVVIYDANIDLPNPNGGTGKTLLAFSFGQIRKLVQEDGKRNRLGRFDFDRLTLGTEIFLMDDLSKVYPFEKLFALITGDCVIDMKSIHRFSIPFNKSPKLVLTSNYCVIKEGDSYTRRVIEFVLDNVFSLEYRPSEAYGHEFFEDWNTEQWHGFDNTMILAIQFYLNNGIIEQTDGRKYYQLQNLTTEEFMEFAKTLELLTKYNKKVKLQEFHEKYPKHPRIESSSFTRWMRLFAQYKNWKTKDTHSGGINYIQFYEGEEPEEEATVEA